MVFDNGVFLLYAFLAGAFTFVAIVAWFIVYESRKTMATINALSVSCLVIITGGLALVFAPDLQLRDTLFIRLVQRATFVFALVWSGWMTVMIGQLLNGRSSKVVRAITWPVLLVRFLAGKVLQPGPETDDYKADSHSY